MLRLQYLRKIINVQYCDKSNRVTILTSASEDCNNILRSYLRNVFQLLFIQLYYIRI